MLRRVRAERSSVNLVYISNYFKVRNCIPKQLDGTVTDNPTSPVFAVSDGAMKTDSTITEIIS